MALHKTKPTSPGRRFQVQVVDSALHKGGPYEPLLAKKNRSGGRNSAGRITIRHKGGGHKQRYRIIDFKRRKDGIPAVVERVEYDPNRTANIALLKYADGERTYIIAANKVAAGDTLLSGREAPIKDGNSLPLANIPVGSTVHCIEPMNPVDHPHGGGEGRTSGGRHPVSPWGVPTKGYKTRSNKRTNNLIVRRRKSK